jgi:hypothetical protein
MSSSPRSRCAKAWYSSHTRSHTALAADLLSTQRPGLIGEGRLDLAYRQPPRVHLHRQARQLFALAGQRRAHLARSAAQPAQLRRIELDDALGAVDAAAANAIAQWPGCIARAGAMRVVLTPTACSTSASSACSIMSLVASRTIRLGSICSPLNTSSRRLRVASLAGTFFTGMLHVGWIERRHNVQSIGCIPLRIHSNSKTWPRSKIVPSVHVLHPYPAQRFVAS